MADILRVTSAAVESLLSTSSASSASNQSFSCRLKVPGKHVKEISLEEVMRRSQDEGLNLAEFLNNQPKTSNDEHPLNIEHRTVTPSKSVLAGSIIEDESRHLVAPSTDSSEYISIIDVGKSLSTDSSLSLSGKEMNKTKNSNSDISLDSDLRGVDLIPVRENSSRKDTSASTVSSLKTAEVVDASTPNSNKHNEGATRESGDSTIQSEDRPKTPDLSDPPPALPPLSIPLKGLKQGSLASVESTRERVVPDIEVKSLKSSKSCTARQMLQGTCAQPKRGAVAIQRVNNPNPHPSPTTDQTSQIAAAVAAAVAATTPYHQLKAELEMKLEKLTAELQKQNASHAKKPDSKEDAKVVLKGSTTDVANDSLDITVVADEDVQDNIGLPTPINPRVAPKPRSHRKPRDKEEKPSLGVRSNTKHVTVDSLRSQFEESLEETRQNFQHPEFLDQFTDQTKEYDLMRKNLLNLLKEAREAKREIEEMRHTERMQGLKTSLRREAPADIYLERIRKREEDLSAPRYSANEREYRTPAYILEAKNTLYEIEEKRNLVERKSYPLDSTYLCDDQEQTLESERISKKITEILDNIQKEIKSKDPKKTVITTEPAKPVKRKLKRDIKLEEKKALYNKLRSENQYHNIQVNIGRLKQEEKALRPHPKVNDIGGCYQSPYKRSGLPQSFPLAPLPNSFPLAPPAVQDHSTPLRSLRHQISTQTSPVTRETVEVPQYNKPSTRDVSVYPSPAPQMLDQQCSPLKVLTEDRAQSYTPIQRNTSAYSYEDSEADNFIGVVDLPPSVTIAGVKRVPPLMDKYSAKLISDNKAASARVPQNTVLADDKASVMQWLEEAILEKLLTETPQQNAAKDEVTQILGEDAMKAIADLGLDLSPAQLHGVVSDIIKGQVEERIAHHVRDTSPRPRSLQKSQADDSKPSYNDSFESSSSTSSKSSLSVAVTPSLTASEESSKSLSPVSELSRDLQPRSPVLTPPLTPEVVSLSAQSEAQALPEGVPKPVQNMSKQPPVYFNDTLEQVPLDLTDEVDENRVTVYTPDLTSLPQDNTVSLEGVSRQLTVQPFTPQNTAQEPVPDESVISQHPLDFTHQSVISQHPLELTGVTENIDIPPGIEPEYSSASSTSVSYTETTDYPISAGEILPGVLPREITQHVFTSGPLSEGEWPLSPQSSDFLQLVKDPEIRGLLEERIRATRSPGYPVFHPQDDTIPEEMVSPLREEGVFQTSDLQAGPASSRNLPPAPRRAPLQTPSPLPKTQSVDNIETLELVTPLPDAEDERVASPSPPPFMGLQLEDYEFSGESVTKSDKSDDSF
ncbi:hypothetical protein ACHWQZ_G012023 [Mnemiopsis leidyi]